MSERVYLDVASERARQDAQWGGPEHDDEHAPVDWMSYVHYQLEKAQREGPGHLPALRSRMVKVAALAVAAIEYCDRAAVEWNGQAEDPEPAGEGGQE